MRGLISLGEKGFWRQVVQFPGSGLGGGGGGDMGLSVEMKTSRCLSGCHWDLIQLGTPREAV